MKKFTFIDLFAGIGGFHLAMENLGGKCVFASEIDNYARRTYEYNFKKINQELFQNGLFNDDIRKISPLELPNFDLLCAGFPCQPFSQAGYKRGFGDVYKSERGNLFFNIVEILDVKKPRAFFLENVRGIINHDNGKTFKTIRDILENELGYSFYFKIIKALDFGLPQLRPRVFMIGFRDDTSEKKFSFPDPIPLRFTMSDVWQGNCSREIGYTLRVGGRGSKIDDRRNWDRYLVDGEVRQIMPEQAKKMQGFPDDFTFPVSNIEAMKQLGNSVAIDAVRACGKQLVDYMFLLDKENKGKCMIKKTKNKGEWTEIYSFLKLLNDKKISLADKDLNPKADFFNVTKITTLNIQQVYHLSKNDIVKIENKETGKTHEVKVSDFLNDSVVKDLANAIKNGEGSSFDISNFHVISNELGVSLIKGGNSNQKADILLDIEKDKTKYCDNGFSIKSHLGNLPTLLNASGNTNFVYKIQGLSMTQLDLINEIETKSKVKDRVNAIYEKGGLLCFEKVEQTTMTYNLNLIDSVMPELISYMLIEFHKNRHDSINKNLEQIYKKYKEKFGTDLDGLKVKIKRLLVAILLGFFAGEKWNGKYLANGAIIVKSDGEQVAYHITDLETLEDYLYENIRFDTPSTTRHRYGSVFMENGELFFKLNLQLRFKSDKNHERISKKNILSTSGYSKKNENFNHN
ncbi:HpaII family restriction endonuclease [Campylobacter sp. IFREMER_LSEM_CL908]|uniref:HpaII family restriction endonuclease n=1 Tax=Campylobacter sp. IFREMER_LSEM_CL908 TaxID=2911624 RepID=UPI0021E73695|nr:HpaII family restriction endonuclease [Campylobacter sp. IFREMER_LSEM_CL908]MCV3393208.1 HpaII family restriction endonuclease [Campylobacter sp. IFREMER_LSEM_CL908]